MMQRVLPFFLLVAFGGGLLLAVHQSAVAQSGPARVDAALNALHQWIGGGEKGDGWRRVPHVGRIGS
jgi:hypothetical protein